MWTTCSIFLIMIGLAFFLVALIVIPRILDAAARSIEESKESSPTDSRLSDLVDALRGLGYRKDDATRAATAALQTADPSTPIPDLVRLALRRGRP